MRFFIDTAKVEDIRKANDMGVICGVTTNPSLIAKEGRVFEEVIAEIASIVDGPISGEVKATTVDSEGMINEGREIAKIHPNMVVKIPMTVEGLKACKALTAEGIKTNVTLVFTANQALLAARAGATYVSPFLGRLDDISQRGVDLIREIADIFSVADVDTQIIAASVRNPIHVTDCALAGADIATVPYSVIEQMVKHPFLLGGALLHLLFLLLDHTTNHLAADGTSLAGSQITVVALLQVNTKLGCNLSLKTIHCCLCLRHFYSIRSVTGHSFSPPYCVLCFFLYLQDKCRMHLS